MFARRRTWPRLSRAKPVGGEEEPLLVRGLTQDLRRASSQLRALLASCRGLRADATAWTGHPSQRQPFGIMIHNGSRVVAPPACGCGLREIGRASCRERVEISVVAVSL